MYTFKKDVVTYKLQSLVEEGIDVATYQILLLMSGKEFFHNFKEDNEVGFTIVVKSKEKDIVKQIPLPKEVQELLD